MRLPRFERNYRVVASDLNGYGLMHGGRLLTLADETAFMSSHQHAESACLTKAVHQTTFHHPAREGDTLLFTSVVADTGRSSLWVPIEVQRADTNELLMDAIFVFVALDDEGKPRQIAPVTTDCAEEHSLQMRIRTLRQGLQA